MPSYSLLAGLLCSPTRLLAFRTKTAKLPPGISLRPEALTLEMNRILPAARLRFAAMALLWVPFGCDGALFGLGAKPVGMQAEASFQPRFDVDQRACQVRDRAALAQTDSGGAPAFDANRVDVLGRALGEPMVFVREPRRTPDELLTPAQRAIANAFDRAPPGVRVGRLVRQYAHQPNILRALLLPDGYVYASDPHDALALVRSLQLTHAFKEPVIWLQRRDQVFRLERFKVRTATVYRYAEGPSEGQEAQLLFGDRVAASPSDLANPLHRDLRTLARDAGFDRTRVLHRTPSAIVANLRFGGRWVRAVLTAEGAKLHLTCLNEPRSTVEAVESWMRDNSHGIRARRAMEATIDAQVNEALPFDRPADAEDHFQDGVLRPLWYDAYRRGQAGFTFDGRSYSVFLSDGTPRPPQVCVDLILDTYERTSGTWFRPRGQAPQRFVGRLDFDGHGIKNRRAVIAFGDFAESSPSLFEFAKIPSDERIPFARRKEFFAYLLEHADDFGPGHVVAIQGRKRDGHIHQHAIFVETTDPVTGFPYGLFDQMKKPRRRTWEGIMAEAPARSLYYRARPTDVIWRSMDGEPGKALPSPFRRLPAKE